MWKRAIDWVKRLTCRKEPEKIVNPKSEYTNSFDEMVKLLEEELKLRVRSLYEIELMLSNIRDSTKEVYCDEADFLDLTI